MLVGILLAFVTRVPHSAAISDPRDIVVAVLIGAIRVPLNVRHHFADVAKGLPRPGELPVADAHDRKHGARTYCYRYHAQAGTVLLELFDSDFGLHSARLSPVGHATHEKCPLLSSEPRVIVGKSRYDLRSLPRSEPSGFQVRKRGDSITFERQWTYSDPSHLHMWGTCFSRVVNLTIEPREGVARSLTVDNWEEPGC